MSIKEVINIREVCKDDLNFILDSSISCLSKYTESLFKGWQYQDIYDYLSAVIITSLHTKSFSILIASHKDDSNHIIGYTVVDPENNHIFLQYTKFAYRKLGVQSIMMDMLVDKTKPISVNWQTKEMLKLQKQGKVTIANKTVQGLILGENK